MSVWRRVGASASRKVKGALASGRSIVGIPRKLALVVTRGHTAAAGLTLLVIAAGVAVGSFLADDTEPDRVTGSLTQLGPLGLTLDAAPGEAVSPVCGCYKIPHRKDWRGISFASRTVELSRLTGEQSTYQIAAATPGPATWEPGYLHFAAEFVVLRHTGRPGRPPFNPAGLLAGGTPSGWAVVRREPLGTQPYALLTTDEPVFVSMLGPTPIGAWVPARSGRVDLGFRQGLTANAPLEGELTERDPHHRLDGRLSHPFADFLGPDVVVWSRDREASIDNRVQEISSGDTTPSGAVVLALVIRKPPFATRVSALPLTIPPRITEGKFMMALDPAKTSGPYRLVLRGQPLSENEYAQMQTRLKERNVFELRGLTGWFVAPRPRSGGYYQPLECHDGYCKILVEESLQTNKTMRFRYPPRPPAQQGFTVFGPLRTLHLPEAKGTFSVLNQPLGAPTNMRLRDVQLLGPSAEGVMPVPADEDGYELDLAASGTSSVNGQPLVEATWFNLSSSLLAISTLTGIVGLYLAAVAWFGRKTQVRRRSK